VTSSRVRPMAEPSSISIFESKIWVKREWFFCVEKLCFTDGRTELGSRNSFPRRTVLLGCMQVVRNKKASALLKSYSRPLHVFSLEEMRGPVPSAWCAAGGGGAGGAMGNPRQHLSCPFGLRSSRDTRTRARGTVVTMAKRRASRGRPAGNGRI
jgi:hypothetical protein